MHKTAFLALATSTLTTQAPAAPNLPPPTARTAECERAADQAENSNDDGRIVGGEVAKAGTAKWQVQFFTEPVYSEAEIEADCKRPKTDKDKLFLNERDRFEWGHKCGGSYIGDGWIVTAAHCVVIDRKPPKAPFDPMKERFVRMGTQSLTDGRGGKFTIDAVVIHGGYLTTVKKHDIALVHVREVGKIAPLLGASLEAVPLQKPSDPPLAPREPLRVTGWGAMVALPDDSIPRRDATNSALRTPADLRQLSVLNFTDGRCATEPKLNKVADAAFAICAGSLKENEDSCTGDSGGPLTRSIGGTRVLVGVVSVGVGCAIKGKGAIYTRISAYYNWIEAAKKQPLGKISRLAHIQ